MRPALNGLLDGLPFRGRMLMPTRAWTSILTSLVTRRRKSPFPPTVLESQIPRLRHASLLRLQLPLMTPELLCIIFLVFFFFFFFFYVRLQNPDICDVVLNEYPIFYLIAVFPFFFFCNRFPDAALSSVDLDRWLYGLCLSSWVFVN